MKIKLQNFWDLINSSFWFVPTLMTIIAAGLSFFTVWLDEILANDLVYVFGYVRGPQGARSLLSTVAGSIITVAGVTFSITIAALTLASSQFGPRLLRNFIRDKGNQIVLGTFISTFMYCLLVLRTINGSQENSFVPHISVTLGVLFATASMGVFIFFIHHVSSLIQVENVIATVTKDLQQTLDRLFPEHLGQSPAQAGEGKRVAEETLPANFEDLSIAIKAQKQGYLQGIDADLLLDIATTRKLIFEVNNLPGQFIIEEMELTRIWPPDKLDEELDVQIRQAFILGSHRTAFQDVEFAIDQLAEIALRALSPGINDPFTAISCIDSLGAGLAQLGKRALPATHRYDEQGNLRMVVNVQTKKLLVDRAVDQIREAANSNTAVTVHLLKMIGQVGKYTADKELSQALMHQADLVNKGSYASLPDEAGRSKVKEAYQKAVLDIKK